jgi:DNA-binding NarL/FixJ family response regulator
MSGQRMNSKSLTEKHKELLPYLAEDKSDRDIAKKLGVSTEYVHQRIERLIDIAKCADRDELVAYAKRYMLEEEKEA